MFKYLTAGESHGESYFAILEGLPAGLQVSEESINQDLQRRQAGYGRSERMRQERDTVLIKAGLHSHKTFGAPLVLQLDNRVREMVPFFVPRPGHADLAGALKYQIHDLHLIAERASARETVARVALGAVCRQLLRLFKMEILSWTEAIGTISARIPNLGFKALAQRVESSDLRTPDKTAEAAMHKLIDEAAAQGNSLGGVFGVKIFHPPPGLGSYTQGEFRLDARLAAAVMSIPSVKGFEIGEAFGLACASGRQAQDAIGYNSGFFRSSNHAGGIEGGISNGEAIYLRAAVKPVPTLKQALPSVDMRTKVPQSAPVLRADTCVVPAAGVVGEAAAALVITQAFLEKFGGDSLKEVKYNFSNYLKTIKAL